MIAVHDLVEVTLVPLNTTWPRSHQFCIWLPFTASHTSLVSHHLKWATSDFFYTQPRPNDFHFDTRKLGPGYTVFLLYAT